MSDDGDDAGQDAPEDDVQDDAIHTFQGHSGMHLLACDEGIHICRHRMPCLEVQAAARQTHCHAATADAVFAVAWNAASPGTVASGSADDTVYMFQVCLLAQPHDQHVHSVAVCHSVRMITVSSAHALQAGGTTEQRLEGHTDTVASLAFSSDGSKLATGGLDGETTPQLLQQDPNAVKPAASWCCYHGPGGFPQSAVQQ